MRWKALEKQGMHIFIGQKGIFTAFRAGIS